MFSKGFHQKKVSIKVAFSQSINIRISMYAFVLTAFGNQSEQFSGDMCLAMNHDTRQLDS